MSEDHLEPLPKLQFETRLHPARDVGPPGVLKWLPLGELAIDRDYQRHILKTGKANIRRMIEEFSWALFGSLVVGRRGIARYAVIDGQHRAIAALLHGGIEDVPCIVVQGGQKYEARAFAAINANTTRLHPLQAFRAAVAGGDLVALDVMRIAAAAGVTIAPYPKADLAAGETMVCTNLGKKAAVHGKATIIAALKLLRAMDPSGGLPNVAVLGAISMVVKHPAWIDRADELGRKVAQPLAAMVSAARQRKASYGGLEWTNLETLLTAAIETATRVSSRFYSPADAKRAASGRA